MTWPVVRIHVRPCGERLPLLVDRETGLPLQLPAIYVLTTLRSRAANTIAQKLWSVQVLLLPFVENNYNVCELGPRGTGKSYVYEEISPNSIMISGGQTTVANLFYNMSRRQVGLVGLWDVVAFDEVAGINFKDPDGVQIMKGYMANGSFARGRESILRQ